MVKYKICGCLTEIDLKSCINMIHDSNADLFEHRIDFMKKIERLEDIYSSTQKPIIATCKKENYFLLGDDDVREILVYAMESRCTYIDIDFNMRDSMINSIMRIARQMGTKVILSWHDYEKTPSFDFLLDVLKKQLVKQPDICKIVTTARSLKDNENILSLYDYKYRKNLIAFSMGEIGKPTRIEALKKGAPFMYASINYSSAPGQFSVKEMKHQLNER
ncbi:MAG: type I 3-dehydroquinate dehydratase [Candidatus Woesearchaeota archaeon]